MSASRAGRNAEPDSAVFFVAISVSMMSPRSISSRCIAFIDAVDLAAQVGEGGRGLGSVSHDGRFYVAHQAKSKKIGATCRRQSGLDEALYSVHYLGNIVVVNLSRSACKPR